jgi:multiple sugar transport system ATP-binding protein
MNLLSGPDAAKYDAHTIGIRPEHLTISAKAGEWEGVVGVSEHLGSDSFFHVTCPAFSETLTVRASGEMDFSYGSKVFLTPALAHLHRFDKAGLRLS